MEEAEVRRKLSRVGRSVLPLAVAVGVIIQTKGSPDAAEYRWERYGHLCGYPYQCHCDWREVNEFCGYGDRVSDTAFPLSLLIPVITMYSRDLSKGPAAGSKRCPREGVRSLMYRQITSVP